MDEDKAKKLFETLDKNKDGKIDLKELEEGLAHQQTRAQISDLLFENADKNHDGEIDFKEFHKFASSKADQLRAVFDSIDTNQDGRLDKQEVRASLQKIYQLTVSEKAVEAMMKHVDKDGDGCLSFNEWVDYLLYLPIHSNSNDTLKHIFDSWKEEAVVDFGETIAVQSAASSAMRNLIAGGFAGAVSRTATAPLDRLKTLIQLQTKGAHVGVLAGLREIYKDGGILAFFRGNFANCLKIVPESATKFYAFEQLKKAISGVRGDTGIVDKFAAGALAGVISQGIVYPLDSLKVRMAASPIKLNLAEAFSQAYASGGPKVFYRGLSASVLGVIPYAGIDLAVYETLKTAYTDYQIRKAGDRQTKPSASVLVPLACGTVSSTIAQFASLQAQGLPNSEKYSGMSDVVVKTVRKEGLLGLYKGMGPNLLKVVPAVGISYVVYESIKNM